MGEMIKLHLIRHGRTQGNVEGRYIGCMTDEDLCREGLNEIKKKADDMKRVCNYSDNTCIFCGPMKRCISTAEALFETADLYLVQGLTEMDFGDFEGKNHKELDGNPTYQKWIDEGGINGFPGGELRSEFIEKNRVCIKQIKRMLRSNNVVVCHGGNIMAIMNILTGEEYFSFQVGNGDGFSLEAELTEDGINVKSYNRINDRICS